MLLVYIAVGGALGAIARYGTEGWVHSWAGAGFPWGTLTINVLGSLTLGFLVRLLEGMVVGPELRGALTIGFLGAFTTFSTFSYETATLMQDGQWSRAGAYALGSLLLALIGVFGGFRLASLVLFTRG